MRHWCAECSGRYAYCGGAMMHTSVRALAKAMAIAALALGAVTCLVAQEPAQESPQEAPAAPPPPIGPIHRAEGKRHGDWPVEAYAIGPGTKFLVRLEGGWDTGRARGKDRFPVTPLGPLEEASGS